MGTLESAKSLEVKCTGNRKLVKVHAITGRQWPKCGTQPLRAKSLNWKSDAASGNQLSMRDVMLFGPATKTPQENTNTVEMRTGKVILEAPPLHSYVPGGCLPSFRTRYHNAKDVDHLVHSSDAYASR